MATTMNKTVKHNPPEDKKKYYMSALKYVDPNTGETKIGYCFASFEDGSDINKVWTYFKVSNAGTITWAIAEITEKEFNAGPYTHDNAIVVKLDKYFHEIEEGF